MTDQHPITPPPELRAKWMEEDEVKPGVIGRMIDRAAQWVYDQCFKLPAHFRGVPLIPPVDCVDPQSWIAQRIYDMGYDQRGEVNEAQLQKARDQELEACCEWLACDWTNVEIADKLRAARRPKPSSLKEQALETLRSMQIEPCWIDGINTNAELMSKYDTIRRALEALPDD